MFLVLIIGLAAGWSIGRFMPGRGFGLIGDLAVGVVGAFAGNHLIALWGLPSYEMFVPAIMAALGSLTVLWFFRVLL